MYSVAATSGPEPGGRDRPGLTYLGGLAVLALLGYQAFGRGTRVPLLGWIDLAVHEFGHVATFVLPEVANAMMGNITQTLLPLALAGVFALRERDWLGTVLCLGWAGTTMQDASVYIADAPYQQLPLIGGYHDWAFALAELGRLHQAEVVARTVWTGGLLLWVAATMACVLGPWVGPAVRRHGVAVLARSPGTAPAGPRPAGPAGASWRS